MHMTIDKGRNPSNHAFFINLLYNIILKNYTPGVDTLESYK